MNATAQGSPARGAEPITPDRRRHERLQTRTPMHILRVGKESVSCDALCTDVSVGGLGFNTWVQLTVGDIIEFEFVNADHAGLTFEARLLYRSGDHYGAYFLQAR